MKLFVRDKEKKKASKLSTEKILDLLSSETEKILDLLSSDKSPSDKDVLIGLRVYLQEVIDARKAIKTLKKQNRDSLKLKSKSMSIMVARDKKLGDIREDNNDNE